MKEYKQWHYCNIYNAEIGDGTQIGSYTEAHDCKIGKNCRIGAYCFIPKDSWIGNYVFMGPGVRLLNDKYPTALNAIRGTWKCWPAIIEDFCSIGAGAIILPGVRLGHHCVVGAGAVVTKSFPPYSVIYGNPAKLKGVSEGSQFDESV